MSLVGGRFKVLFTYRSDPRATSVIDSVGMEQILNQALTRIDARLPSPATTIDLVVDPPKAVPCSGVGGFAADVGRVIIYFDPRYGRTPTENISRSLPLVLAHELHHQARGEYGNTLLQAVISEGLAEVFAQEVFPDLRRDVEPSLTAAKQRELWERLKPVLDRIDHETHEPWFSGGQDIPEAAGYMMGEQIVRSYLRNHPGATAASLVRTPAEEILAGSRYAS